LRICTWAAKIHSHFLINDGVTSGCGHRAILLKSPNWLYGQRKAEDNDVAQTRSTIVVKAQATEEKNEQEFEDLNWLASLSPDAEEELFTRYTFQYH
jgi:hypothetical protein